MSNESLENRIQALESEVKRLNSLITAFVDDRGEKSVSFVKDQNNNKIKKTASNSSILVFKEQKLTEKLKKKIINWINTKKEGELIYPSDLMFQFKISYEDSVNILDILEEADKIHKM